MKPTIKLLLLGSILASGCTGPAVGTEGAACPNDRNCISPLKCIEGFCAMAPEGNDAGVVDMGVPDTGPVDTGVMPDAGPNYMDDFNSGTFAVTPDGMTLGHDMMMGRAGLMREERGYTNVLVHVTGLEPNAMYPVHVHEAPCNMDIGGGHYKIDPTVMDVVEANEIWPNITTDMDGNGYGSASVNHYARTEMGEQLPLSVVIHSSMGPEKIACADLMPNADVTANGTFYELMAGMGSGITGTASLRRYRSGTVASVELMGNLMPGATYPVHVHAARCADNEGGGHYKIDPNVMEVDQANELWPVAEVNAAGTAALGEVTVRHIARYDAWSVVVHDPMSPDKLLCADLTW